VSSRPTVQGGLRVLQEYMPTTRLDQYVFRLELVYRRCEWNPIGDVRLGQWTGTFTDLAATGCYGAPPSIKFREASRMKSCAVRLWTKDTAPWSMNRELDLPVAGDDDRKWGALLLQAYVSYGGQTHKICADQHVTSGWEFEGENIVRVKPNEDDLAVPSGWPHRTSSSSEYLTDKDLPGLEMWPELHFTGEHENGEDLEPWETEVRVALNLIITATFFGRDPTANELLAALELRMGLWQEGPKPTQSLM